MARARERRRQLHKFLLFDIFPPGPLSTWVMQLSIARNDLMTVQKWLAEILDREDDKQTIAERLYLFRLLCAHSYEAMRIITSSRPPDPDRAIQRLIDSLSPETKTALKRIKHYWDSKLTDQLLRPVRLDTFHYDWKLVHALLDYLRESDPGMKGELQAADASLDVRYLYADQVLAGKFGLEKAEIEDSFASLKPLLQAIWKFVNDAVQEYVIKKGDMMGPAGPVELLSRPRQDSQN